MKKVYLGLLLSALGGLNLAPAQANNICDTQLFKELVMSEKGGIKRPNIIPSRALKNIIDNEELLCPMQVEKDFNGDKVLDWVGILEQNNKFFLAAYISGRSTHKLSKIKEYAKVPGNQYLDAASKKTLKRIAGVAPMKFGTNFVAIENQVNGNSIAYGWDGKKMVELIKFNFSSEVEDNRPL
ncbi:hypothetical protein FLL45_02435 [Aliikangiella marina]|uniref:VCBS repeat-containing protein n=1 Tax=Aliikangiella marina TaxID=1712262 RepID=A0A545THX9_9GAMM|nr:hypothetical protein [Aliikangiella marina]TQV76833.1 hypothetical protein FLL45_02435 [Aliikangiella marina]